MDGRDFKARWAEFARERGIPDDPFAHVATTTIDARRIALEFFTAGIEYNVASNRQWAELLGDKLSAGVTSAEKIRAAEMRDEAFDAIEAARLTPTEPGPNLGRPPKQLPIFDTGYRPNPATGGRRPPPPPHGPYKFQI